MNARALTAFLGMVAVAPCAAIADGAPPPSPPPPVSAGCCEPFLWTGVYLGLQVGGAWSDPRWTAPGENFSISESGTIFGGYVGVNYQMQNLVVGGEVAYADNGERGQATGTMTSRPSVVRVPDLLTVAGRLGFARDQFLFYGRAGFASSRVEIGAVSLPSGPLPSGLAAHASQRENGWILGTGFEARMISNMVFGVEYNYVGLPGGRFTATPAGMPFNVDLGEAQVQTIMARFSILFGPTACCGEGLLGKY
jgi:outer membrane immunogenic protein